MDNDSDAVNRPKHYRSHPSGVECITITEHMGFNLGNALKYIWRADLKNDAVEDLRKAEWYIRREIDRRTRSEGVPQRSEPNQPSDGARALSFIPVPDGVYDNSGTMRRESWFKGEIVEFHAAVGVDRKNSGYAPFGTYPDIPRT